MAMMDTLLFVYYLSRNNKYLYIICHETINLILSYYKHKWTGNEAQMKWNAETRRRHLEADNIGHLVWSIRFKHRSYASACLTIISDLIHLIGSFVMFSDLVWDYSAIFWSFLAVFGVFSVVSGIFKYWVAQFWMSENHFRSISQSSTKLLVFPAIFSRFRPFSANFCTLW